MLHSPQTAHVWLLSYKPPCSSATSSLCYLSTMPCLRTHAQTEFCIIYSTLKLTHFEGPGISAVSRLGKQVLLFCLKVVGWTPIGNSYLNTTVDVVSRTEFQINGPDNKKRLTNTYPPRETCLFKWLILQLRWEFRIVQVKQVLWDTRASPIIASEDES